MARLSQHNFAALAGVSQQAVSVAARDGRLVAAPGGGLDPDHPVNQAFLANHKPSVAGIEGTAAKVAAFAAKAALLRQRLDDEEAELVERDSCIRANLDRVPAVHAWLAGIPERRANELAMAVGCPTDIARVVLTEIVRIAGELGDIGSEVTVAMVAA